MQVILLNTTIDFIFAEKSYPLLWSLKGQQLPVLKLWQAILVLPSVDLINTQLYSKS